MSKASRDKGARGELEACRALEQVLGGEWQRSLVQSRGGGAERPDVECHDYEGLHVEVKRAARVSWLPALSQAVADAGLVGPDQVPVVLGRQDRGEWCVLVRLADLPRLADLLREAPCSRS